MKTRVTGLALLPLRHFTIHQRLPFSAFAVVLQAEITHSVSFQTAILIIEPKTAHSHCLQSALMDLWVSLKQRAAPRVKCVEPTHPTHQCFIHTVTWEMWGTQIDRAPFPSVVKFIWTHPTTSVRGTWAFLLSHNWLQMWGEPTHIFTQQSAARTLYFLFNLCG